MFDTSVILFYAVVQRDVCPMYRINSYCFAYSTWIGTMPVCCDMVWGMTNDRNGLREELFCRIHIPFLTQSRIHQVAIVINGPIEIAPLL